MAAASRSVLRIAVAAALAAIAVGAAAGAERAQPTLQVPRDADVRLDGPRLSPAAAGFPWLVSLEAVGDVNGDGKPELAIATTQGHHGDETRSFVLFGGRRLPAVLALPAAAAYGFAVRDALVAPAGDVNGDGRADLLRCPRSSTSKAGATAETTVLFGRAGTRPASDRGLRVRGASCGLGAGDLDGDGLDDLLFATVDAHYDPTGFSVVYGARKPTPVALGRLGRRGYRIVAGRSGSLDVKPVGDVNGDGHADLVANSSPARYRSGRRLRVVFGSHRTATLDLDAAAARKLPTIVCDGRELGIATSGFLGDVDGDGVGDLALTPALGGTARTSTTYVLSGRSGTWPSERSCHDRSIALTKNWSGPLGPAGDIDGDGFGDMLIGNPQDTYPASSGSAAVSGTVYLIYGRPDGTTIDLARDERVVRIRLSGEEGSRLGAAYAAPGDVSGDGAPDIAVGDDTLGLSWIVSGKLRS